MGKGRHRYKSTSSGTVHTLLQYTHYCSGTVHTHTQAARSQVGLCLRVPANHLPIQDAGGDLTEGRGFTVAGVERVIVYIIPVECSVYVWCEAAFIRSGAK